MANKRVSLKGKGSDLFFGDYQPEPLAPTAADAPLASETLPSPAGEAAASETVLPIPEPTRSRATPRPHPDTQARKLASPLASPLVDDPDVIHAIRAVVKIPGREVSFIRMSLDEKERLSEVIYTFKKRGHKITETDITRIAVNYILADYDRAGDDSVLARLLASLRA